MKETDIKFMDGKTMQVKTALGRPAHSRISGSYPVDPHQLLPIVYATRRKKSNTPTENSEQNFYDDLVNGGDQPRLSVKSSADRDSAYQQAIESGDMETAQELVNEVADESGYIRVHHQTGGRLASIVSMCALFLLAAIALSVTACTNGKADDRADANGAMNIDFGEDGMIRNGTEHDTYQVEEGQKGVISIRVSRVSGRLDIDVYPVDNRDTPNYTGRDLASASFDVIVEKPGEYEVCFTATEFVGDYGIGWSIEDNTDK